MIERIEKKLIDLTNTVSSLIRAIEILQERIGLMDAAIDDLTNTLMPEDEIESTTHMVNRVECYTSRSGNKTWKAHTESGHIIYLRQSHRDMLEDAKLWPVLDAMTIDQDAMCDLTIQTVPDGDFMKPIRVDGTVYLKVDDANGTDPDLARLRQLVMSTDFVVLDTETHDMHGYVCQVAVVAPDGDILFQSLIKPPDPIEPGAQSVHGISNEQVADAPELCDPAVAAELLAALEGTTIIGWNVQYDLNALMRTAQHYTGNPHMMRLRAALNLAGAEDAMQIFAPIYGEWNDYHQSYTWQKLTTAAAYYGISSDGAHDAAADALMTLEVVKQMLQ